MRIAVIADIHGNLPALEAVLADIQHRNVDRTINLGDCVSGPLWPREVCDQLMASDNLTIRGNHDRWCQDPIPHGWVHRTGTLIPTSTRTTALGSKPCQPWHMQIMVSLPATAHQRTTISILSRRCRNIGWCEHIHRRSGNGCQTFRLVWFCVGTATE